MNNYTIVITIVFWIIGVACVLIMKKIEPKNKIYPAWVLFIEVAFTLFAVFYECL